MIFKNKIGSFIWVSIVMIALLGETFFAMKSFAGERKYLIEGARKEGKVTLYAAMNQSDTNRIVNKFMEKYPFIRAEFYYSPTDKLLTKILAELRAGKLPADAIQLGLVLADIVRQHGGMSDYVSPELEGIPDGFKDPKGCWGSAYIITNVIAYNTRLVKGKDIPKSYQSLLDPKWKGKKMGFGVNELRWFIAQMGIMGEEKGLQFMRKLADQDLKMFPSKSVTRTMLAAGEISITVNAATDTYCQIMNNGAPIDWVAINPVQTSLLPIFVAKTAPHPNAAKLLVDFILSREGQMVMRSLGRIPTRRDVPPDPLRLTQGLTFHPDTLDEVKRFDEYNRMFNKIFMKKE